MIPFIGFAPDADPTQPGVITDCDQIIPYEAGIRSAPKGVDRGISALDDECRGAAVLTDLNGNRNVWAGTETALYENLIVGWSDRSRSGGYTLGTDARWSFIQYGNSAIAATPGTVLQRSTGAAFADIAGAPMAKLVEAAQGFVMALNTSNSVDEWHCSAYLDDTDWTLDVTTQCVSGRLVGGSGPINAARRFGDDIIAYKSGAMFIGRYQGPPAVWGWQIISNDVGCVGQEAVADTPRGHVFVGRDNVYLFDGTVPRPLATGTIRKWLFADMNPEYQFKTSLLWDRVNHVVWIFYCSASSTTLNRCVAFHIITERWGAAHQAIEATININSPSLTYTGNAQITTFDTGPEIPFDSPFWIAGAAQPAVFDTSHVVKQLSGTAESSYFVTGDIGDDAGYTFCDEVRLRYTQEPASSSMTAMVRDTADGVLETSSTTTASDGKHDARQTGRWHRFRFDTEGDFKLSGVIPKLKPSGRR